MVGELPVSRGCCRTSDVVMVGFARGAPELIDCSTLVMGLAIDLQKHLAMGSIQSGVTVVVIGADPVGIMAANCALLFASVQVIVVDYMESRLESARTYASCKAYNFRSLEDVVLFMKKMTGWLGADMRIAALGAEAAENAAQTLLSRKLLPFV